ncbi:transglutaminaseTgpA domain-containing protein [Natrarchaeobius sp. A-rgal3]|uniref:transglutaminaseTgpA domain-containing protein n=1 Tax=Natrarchaeobius versutus TaxID=1679078 RepID=UPI00351085D2
MSTNHGSGSGSRTMRLDADGTIGPTAFRLLALGCVLILTASYVSVLLDVTRVVGGTQTLFALVGSMLVVATVLARAIRPRTATAAAIVAGAVGFAYYLETSGLGVGVIVSGTGPLLDDVLTLATGMPLLRMIEAGVWTLAFVPAPVFLSWYLAVRGRYASSAVPGGAALLFLVLTGDAGTAVTLIGTLGAIGTVGFGELERRGGSVAQADLIAVLFALIVALSLSVTFVPAGPANPTTAGGASDGTLEGTIDSASERSGISGQVDLSPEVRFTVESDRPSYWRTGIYDRFTGDEWVRTGTETPLEDDDAITTPPGPTQHHHHVVTAETELGVMPAVPEPAAIEGDIVDHTEVSRHGHVHPTTTLMEGDTYAVESAVVTPQPGDLREAGTDYPDEIREHYLQRPEETSSEFEERTAEITAGAETPYEKAVAIERHLRSSKEYSLDVEQPEGNVAEEFLLEMDEGYCVYFATAMTQMLRAEDVPARYVTGYTSGEQVDDDEYVVRGLDAHAWVEVYFPETGWVAFEPTPSSERDSVHEEHLEEAQEDEREDADEPDDEPIEAPDDDEHEDDADEHEDEATDESIPEEDDEPPANDSQSDQEGPASTPPGGQQGPIDTSTDDGEDDRELSPPVAITRELLTITAVLLVGLVAGVHRAGVVAGARRTVGLFWHGRRRDPASDAERAYRRLEALLAREYRPRRADESAREYISALEARPGGDVASDLQVRTVLECYERAVYGGGVDREDADEAIRIVDRLVRNRLPVIGGSSTDR